MTVPLRTQPLTFSTRTLQQLHEKFRPAEQEPLTVRQKYGHQTAGGTPPTAIYDVERAIAIKAREYLETDAQRRFRYAQWIALILSLIFIASIVVLLVMLCVRMNDVFDAVDGSTTSAKVSNIMDLAVHGAENTRLATQNMLHVSEYARNTASIAAPQLENAVNSTSALVTDLRSWSFHPSLSIAPGHVTNG